MAGLYIHIPFCASRCSYCGFYSTTLLSLQDKYTDCLCKEMQLRRNYIKSDIAAKDIPNVINTIYIGGGTPSQLSVKNLKKILESAYNLFTCNVDELTIEVNPDDVSRDFAKAIADLGFNRVSMGAQTFDDDRLKFLNRRHKSWQVRDAVHALRDAGICNVSIDLMFGFPQQTLKSWIEDINNALALDVEHISAYSLMYEEGTRLNNMLTNKEIDEIDEETSLSMYNELIDMLSEVGYEHYEISNFAKPDCRSHHNSSYWQDVPYIGIGAAAHSYNTISRQWNISDIRKYISALENGTLVFEKEDIDEDTHYNDIVTTALRTSNGIMLSKLKEKYVNHIMSEAAEHITNKHLELINGRLKLTHEGLFISDLIMSDLMII